MPKTKERKSDRSPLRLLAWTAFAGIVFGILGLGEIAEDVLRAGRNSLHWHKASGQIVLVAVDDQSLRDVGRWPWPRRRHAELTEKLTNAGADRIFFDLLYNTASDASDDAAFEAALKHSGRAVLAVNSRAGLDHGAELNAKPLARFSRYAGLSNISVAYNYQNAVWRVPYAVGVDGQALQSFAVDLARKRGEVGDFFIPDYSIDPQSVPVFSATDVLAGRVAADAFKGKDIVVGTTADLIGDKYFLPGTGKLGGAYVHIIGAETLKAGTPVYFGWIPLFLVSLAIATLAAVRHSTMERVLLIGGGLAALLVGTAAVEAHLLVFDVAPGLFVIITVGTVLSWRRFRSRGLVHPVSGLPNLAALRSNKAAGRQAVVVARVLNYADMTSALPLDGEKQLIDQIVARLSIGASDKVIYQGDGGIFVWTEAPGSPFGNHLDALSAVFRNPARVGGLSLDLSVAFGVELGSGRSVANRLASAAVAADLAASHGLKWKYHDPQSLQDASWRLSMMSQLDEAIDRGEVWVAYQPKLDLRTRQIIGAEALARWTHPQKGPIAASEFVAAAEQHDRIGKLTDFVLEQAIGAAATLHRRQPAFEMAVNLSARLLSDRQLPLRLRAMLARHGLPPANLVLELTETAELGADGVAIERLVALRDLGLTISIDDYGTGLSTLDYLKKVPAGEIKIDQSFIRGLVDNRSDRLMVQSTIALAHSLGRRVVAEGVEHRETIDVLTELDCDIAQGFIIGRPMSIESLTKRISAPRKGPVAQLS